MFWQKKSPSASWSAKLHAFVRGRKTLSDDDLDHLRRLLLQADFGSANTQYIINQLRKKTVMKGTEDIATMTEDILLDLLRPCECTRPLDTSSSPTVILVIGINGVGKTTSIGKLAHHFKKQGKSVLLAAGDTFRAGAIEQLTTWSKRAEVPIVKSQEGGDSAAVLYDAVHSAQASGTEVIIGDTAGRMHTRQDLMGSLTKIRKTLSKIDPKFPHEVILVLDATLGQNGLKQAQAFHEIIPIDSLILTKLDGTAKGGMVFSVAKTLNVPIRFIGTGEGIDDLEAFSASALLQQLFPAS